MESTTAVEIRTARAGEVAACRLLLAADRPPRDRGERFLAAVVQRGGGEPHLVGASCYVKTPDLLVGIRLRVIRPMRRQGIGSRLLNAVLDEARRNESKRVYLAAWRKPNEEEVSPFLDRHGFARTLRIVHVEASVPLLADYYRELCRRLQHRGRIPSEARVVPLREAPRDQVLQVIAKRLQEREEPGTRVATTVQHSRYDECPVVMDGSAVAGVLLWEVNGEMGEIPVRVVAAGYQGSWVNALLLAHATEQGFERSIERIRFEIPEGNSDTVKLAARYQAEVVGVQERYERVMLP
jgi:GNAT superfamily N-acetyltransferase